MKFISILTGLLLIFILGCDDDSSGNSGNTDDNTNGGDTEINYSICNNCIWLQNDCNGNWIVGYNFDSAIGGFQFNVDGASINSASGGDAETAGLSVSIGNQIVLGFSLTANSIPAGSGTLCVLDLNGTPTQLSGIVLSNPEGTELEYQNAGLVNCYSSSLDNTGESQLTIFLDSITSLTPGDEIGIFDLQAITNYNDCSNQIGELLVGAGVWNGTQLEIVTVGSVDLCSFDGPQLAGFVPGNPLIVKIYRPSNGLEYSTELSFGEGLGNFGYDSMQSITNIILINPSLSRVTF